VGKREATKHAADAGGPAVATEPLRTAENEEWAWMVDEDPAFYLEETAADKRGG
jgi:hypothetical protein